LRRKAGSITLVLAAALALAALAAAWPGSALAQCPLCRSGLQNAGDQTARTLNLAIVVLLIPPVSIFCAIFAVVYRRARGGDDRERNREP
jgi:heme/copper-type cytochrome/quinol oxidase subunit 2